MGWHHGIEDSARGTVKDDDADQATPNSNPPNVQGGDPRGDLLPLDKHSGKAISELDKDSWSRLPQDLVIDSGAGESVMPVDWCPHYVTVAGQAKQDGDYYTAANGEPIYNEGEKELLLVTIDNRQLRTMTFQVAKVNKALGAVSQIVKKGNRVVFEAEGSYFENRARGDKIWLEERTRVYTLPLMVAPPKELAHLHALQSQGFPRQGRPF